MPTRLMRYPQSQTVLARLVEHPRASQKVRLAALAQLQRPSLALLLRLLGSPTTPSRLLALASEKYSIVIVRRELKLNAKRRRANARQPA
jgi:hypothetical protein